MKVTFYLTQASANTAAGPFNISGTTSGGVANTVEIQANVSKAILLTGYTEEIANNITGGTVTSTDGTCNTTDTWSVNELYQDCPDADTLVETYCVGTTQWGTYNDGSCGTYDDPIAINSVDCGYVAPCFIEGTNITLADGSQVLIETLQVGDVLKSFAIDTLPLYSDDDTVLTTWNTETLTGNQSTASIVSITPVQVSEIVVINNLLKTTPDHKHLVKHDGVWSFVSAYNVVVGDTMIDINNNEVEIISVEVQKVEKTVYKMDVETLDVFYAENVLTHNIKNPETDGTYNCSSGSCVAALNGTYSSLSACNAACTQVPA